MTASTGHAESSRVIRVVQITDTHLYADASGCLLGLNTEQSLQAVVADVRKNRLPADLILATGDLTHDSSQAAYERVFSHLGSFGLPVYCLPGNHDETLALQKSIGAGLHISAASACHGNWQFILLDSTVAGSEGGHLSPQTLQDLDARLAANPELHTLVCLHHQPVPMGSRWIDTMAVDNPDEFFDIIDRHPQVRGILWGHVHQELDRMRNTVRLMSTPSTCIQFSPGSTDFALDTTAPGYRWLNLHADGKIETGVNRLAKIPGKIDMTAGGY
ncbi:MAG: 3',5'-cyclic-AMP phosphodiesterase [Gammaproteobacteria bacterium]